MLFVLIKKKISCKSCVKKVQRGTALIQKQNKQWTEINNKTGSNQKYWTVININQNFK